MASKSAEPSLTPCQERAMGALMGCAAGDKNGGPQRMALRIAESLIDNKGFQVADILTRYRKWYHGPPLDLETAFDTGAAFAGVMTRISTGVTPLEAVQKVHKDFNSGGVNPAHRVCPLAMLPNEWLLSGYPAGMSHTTTAGVVSSSTTASAETTTATSSVSIHSPTITGAGSVAASSSQSKLTPTSTATVSKVGTEASIATSTSSPTPTTASIPASATSTSSSASGSTVLTSSTPSSLASSTPAVSLVTQAASQAAQAAQALAQQERATWLALSLAADSEASLTHLHFAARATSVTTAVLLRLLIQDNGGGLARGLTSWIENLEWTAAWGERFYLGNNPNDAATGLAQSTLDRSHVTLVINALRNEVKHCRDQLIKDKASSPSASASVVHSTPPTGNSTTLSPLLASTSSVSLSSSTASTTLAQGKDSIITAKTPPAATTATGLVLKPMAGGLGQAVILPSQVSPQAPSHVHPRAHTLNKGGFSPDALAAALAFVSHSHDFESALLPSLEFAGYANFCPGTQRTPRRDFPASARLEARVASPAAPPPRAPPLRSRTVLVGALAGARYGFSSINLNRHLSHSSTNPATVKRLTGAATTLAKLWK